MTVKSSVSDEHVGSKCSCSDHGDFIPILQSMILTEWVLKRLVVQVVQGNPNEFGKAMAVWSDSQATAYPFCITKQNIGHSVAIVGVIISNLLKKRA